MKKIFLGFAALPLLALLATSCGKESVELKDDAGKELTFKAATGKQVFGRASEVSLSDLQDDQLKVYSYNATSGSFYMDFDLNYSGSPAFEWSYGIPIFHPISFALNHYSVHPDIALPQTDPIKFNYTIEDTGVDQEDLMVASASTNSASVVDATANLLYKHILSQVNFAIQGKEDLYIAIDNIKIVDIKNTGTFTFGAIGSGGTWTSQSGTVSYDYTPAGGNATDGTNAILYLGNGGGINNHDNALMLMPQDLESSAQLTFDYTLTNVLLSANVDNGSVTVQLDQLGVNKWEQGKRYLYNIIFDPVLLQFTVDVEEDWVDYESNPIDVNESDMTVVP